MRAWWPCKVSIPFHTLIGQSGKMRQKALRSFWKFIAAAARIALIAFPAVPFSRLRFKRCSLFRCPMLGSTAARRFIHRHRLRIAVRPVRRFNEFVGGFAFLPVGMCFPLLAGHFLEPFSHCLNLRQGCFSPEFQTEDFQTIAIHPFKLREPLKACLPVASPIQRLPSFLPERTTDRLCLDAALRPGFLADAVVFAWAWEKVSSGFWENRIHLIPGHSRFTTR